MKHLLSLLLLALFAVTAGAQTVNLAPPLAYSTTPGEGFRAANYPSLNSVASTDGASLSLLSASYMPGGAKSTMPKAYPPRPQWSAYEYLPSGTYTARWTVLMTCPAPGEKATSQAVILAIGPLRSVTHYSLFSSGVPRDFTETFAYAPQSATEAMYFTFQLDANPLRDSSNRLQVGCKYTLTELSLTAQ